MGSKTLGWGKENCPRVFEVRNGLTIIIMKTQQTVSCIAALNVIFDSSS